MKSISGASCDRGIAIANASSIAEINSSESVADGVDFRLEHISKVGENHTIGSEIQ